MPSITGSIVCECKIFSGKGLFTNCSCISGEKKNGQLVEEERIKQGFVCLANGRPDPFLSYCPLSDGLRFLHRSLKEGHRLSSDFYIYLFWKLQS